MLLYLKYIFRIFPAYIRAFIYRHFSMLDLRKTIAEKKYSFNKNEHSSSYQSKYPFCIGIIKEIWHYHWYFVAACRELNISYKIIDITGPIWIKKINESNCDAFLIRPSVVVSVWKEMYDERIKIMNDVLGKIIYPTMNEIWIFENKRRMFYWLNANGFSTPPTYIFYDKKDALRFAKRTKLPIVYKSTIGSGGRGVKIFHKRIQLINFIKKFFRSGYVPSYHEKKDKEWGSMLFQDYIPDMSEWRIIRIDNSFFGYEKLCVNGLHSGSGKWRYLRPPDELLHLTKEITDRGCFNSMNLDIFITRDSSLLVNEMQTFFGSQYKEEMCVVDSIPGRMIYDKITSSWNFEAGDFCRNNLCNLRAMALIKMLENG